MKKTHTFGISLFIILVLNMISPIAAETTYSFGIPDAGKGVATEDEIKDYDDEIWNDILDTSVTALWTGKSDDVGAKSKSVVNDWEEEDQTLLLNLLSQLTFTIAASDYSLLEALDYLNESVADPTAGMTVTVGLMVSILSAGNVSMQTVAGAMGPNLANLASGTITGSYVENNYDMKTTVTNLIMDKWDFTTDGYADDPDSENAEAPFIQDPADISDLWDNAEDMLAEVNQDVTWVVANLTLLEAALTASAIWNISNSLYYQGVFGSTPPDILLNVTRDTLISQFGGVSVTAKDALVMLLLMGIPIYVPVADFIDEVIQDFNIDSITSDGAVITIEMDKDEPSLYIGTAKEDYTIEITYGDTGSQSLVVFKDADGTVFFQKEKLPIFIPGYEMLFLLGSTTLGILGLIYVFKKRRL